MQDCVHSIKHTDPHSGSRCYISLIKSVHCLTSVTVSLRKSLKMVVFVAPKSVLLEMGSVITFTLIVILPVLPSQLFLKTGSSI